MNLISFGCSFIYGSDLADDGQGLCTPMPDGTFKPRFSHLTWPALMAKKLNYTYDSYALPGIGNLQIGEQVLNQLAVGQQGLYVISWTWIDRFDHYNSHTNCWQTIMPADKNSESHVYYQYLHSQYQDKLSNLIIIKLVIDSLKQKNQPFIMTYMDDLIFETEWHTSPAVATLQNYCRDHMFNFDNMTFLNWSRANQYPESPHWHPREQAHQAASDYVLKLGLHQDTYNTSR